MNLIPQRFHSLFNKNSPLPYIIILGLFFLVASCSTKSPDSPLKPYHDQTGKHEDSKDQDFNYRMDRLYPKEQETAKGQDLESFSGPATLADLKGFADDLDRASLEKAIMNQLQAMFEQELSTPVRLGAFTLTRGRLVETLEVFLAILQQDLPFEEFNKKISEEFVLYRVGKGKGKNKKMLFTGYYRPVIQASPIRTPLYRYPLY